MLLGRKKKQEISERLRPLVGRSFIIAFDWNYSKLSLEDAKKHYLVSVQAVVELEKIERLVLKLQTPIKTDDRLISVMLGSPRLFGHSLDKLLYLKSQEDLIVNLAMLRNEKTAPSWDKLHRGDVEFLGVGSILSPPPTLPLF